MPSEFALIERYFRRATRQTLLGVGDDGALFSPAPGCALVVSTDMLVEGTHFFADAEPESLGWKTLAVNVSDLAAMGAQPRWALLAAALPEADEVWIAAFARGFFDCAERFAIDVIGGDTTRGPRNFCVTIFGEVPVEDGKPRALLRSGARPGDEVWVSGTPGRAALGLAHLQGRITLDEPLRSACLAALHRPQPRVGLGLALRGLASAAIDVSDGLLADLGHVLEASGVSATLRGAVLPESTFGGDVERDCFLAGGDDYELAFTAPAARHDAIVALGERLGLPLACLGRIDAGSPGEVRVLDAAGQPIGFARRGFDHFG